MTKTIKPETTIEQIIEELGAEKLKELFTSTSFQYNGWKIYIQRYRDRYAINVAALESYRGANHYHSNEMWQQTTHSITVSIHKTPAEIKKDIDRRIDWAGLEGVKAQHDQETESTKKYIESAAELAYVIHQKVGGKMVQAEPGRHVISLYGDWYTNSAGNIVISGPNVSFDFQSMSNPKDITTMVEAIKNLTKKN